MLKKIIAIALATAISPAWALPFVNTPAVGTTTGDLQFNGTINQSCNLFSFVDGTIVASIDQTIMDSTISGGAPAQVEFRTNVNGYTLNMGAAYLIDPHGTILNNVTINTAAVANGNLLNGTPVSQFGPDSAGTFFVDGGIYNASVNAQAVKDNGAAFEAGTYVLRVPLSCTKA